MHLSLSGRPLIPVERFIFRDHIKITVLYFGGKINIPTCTLNCKQLNETEIRNRKRVNIHAYLCTYI